ncbi:MAG: TIGR04282 family arsenosugar biosynthesis glycosyltransferase [Actinomycetota bacterium]
MTTLSLIIIAKAPHAGISKTRLCPPFTEEQAAVLAEACLTETLRTVSRVDSVNKVLALDGARGGWLPKGIEVIEQRGKTLSDRLTNAFVDARCPAFLIGMDTPQIDIPLLNHSISRLQLNNVDAVLGLSPDGGWWGIGLKHFVPSVFQGIPTSTDATGVSQLLKLKDLGYRTELLPELQDIDVIDDAVEVAGLIPNSHFALTLASML